MAEVIAKSEDPDSAASDLGLYCLQIILLGVSGLQWVKHRRRCLKITWF